MIEPVALEAIHAAHRRLSSEVIHTPLVPLRVDGGEANIFLKLENLGPIGSFKLRGAGNALASSGVDLADGVYTASAGNMAQAVGWIARERGVPCSVIVPDHAPAAKLEAIARLGAEVIKVSFEQWWEVIVNHTYPGFEGRRFVHPVCDPSVIAGNATIGVEIFDQLPEVNTVVVPYGGGGLSAGIASAMRALSPTVRVFGAEVETAAPLWAAFAQGEPADVDYQPTFVDGIGSGRVLDEMWPLVRQLLEGSLVVTLDEIAEAVRLMAERNHVVAEGAGAAPVAAALSGAAGGGTVVCVVSGGNINPGTLAHILDGEVPRA